jgi:uncharacterized protein YdcH (DUF465 family)
MGEKEADLVKKLLQENETFRVMKEKHAALETDLQRLETKSFLTPQDELEIKKIKKMKLVFKDEMHKILATYRTDS